MSDELRNSKKGSVFKTMTINAFFDVISDI